MKNMNISFQKAQQILSRINQRPTLRHTRIKLSKDRDKEGLLKAAREKQLIIYKVFLKLKKIFIEVELMYNIICYRCTI